MGKRGVTADAEMKVIPMLTEWTQIIEVLLGGAYMFSRQTAVIRPYGCWRVGEGGWAAGGRGGSSVCRN